MNKVIFVLLAIAVVALLAFTFKSDFHAEKAKTELLRFYGRIALGQPIEVCSREFESGQFDFLKISTSPECVSVETPTTFGGLNWVAIIGIENGAVVWKKIRTADNPHTAPIDAPKDSILRTQ